MAGDVQLVSDGEGVVITGKEADVQRFLADMDLTSGVTRFELRRLSTALRSGAEVAKSAAGIAEQSAMYLKLTPESAKRLQEAGGLMQSKAKGISHAMLGTPGKVNKWLQVETGPTSLLTNPAVLSGVGGLMSQFAQQAEARELNALLVRIDEKLDGVQRGQRDAVLAMMNRAAAAIEEAMTIHRHGGDAATLWSKVSGESATIFEVQDAALLALGALTEKVSLKSKAGELKKAAQEIERDVGIQLAVLARCFELQDQFRVVELDHVLATAPDKLDGHRLGIAEAREARRTGILELTSRLMSQIDAAGDIANANILLHARAARSVIDSLNFTAEIIEDFQGPVGITSTREPLGAVGWREALRDPGQLKTAGKEAGQAAAMVCGTALALAVGAIGAKSLPKKGS